MKSYFTRSTAGQYRNNDVHGEVSEKEDCHRGCDGVLMFSGFVEIPGPSLYGVSTVVELENDGDTENLYNLKNGGVIGRHHPLPRNYQLCSGILTKLKTAKKNYQIDKKDYCWVLMRTTRNYQKFGGLRFNSVKTEEEQDFV